MKILAIRIAAALIYAFIAFGTAQVLFSAEDSVFLVGGFFAWNIACATAFSYVVTRVSGRSPAYVLLVVLFGTLLQIAILDVRIAEVMGETLGAVVLKLPSSLVGTIASDPLLHVAWLAVPVLAAAAVVHFQGRMVTR